MSNLAPDACQPEWKNRKRRGEFLQEEAVRRCPSYLDTEVKDPAYKKIASIVDAYVTNTTTANATEKTRAFVANMENYLGIVTSDAPEGVLLLQRMLRKKKLAMLVSEKIKAASCAVAFLDEASNPFLRAALTRVEDSLMVNVKNLKDASWSRAFNSVHCICKIVGIRDEQRLLKRKLEIASRGGSVVEWSDDDDV